MKKILKLFWQVLLFPVLYIPYTILNRYVLVIWLGCGCSRIDANGNIIINHFNANHFTGIFWSVVALAVIVISLFNMKKLSKWYTMLIYIVLLTGGSLYIAWIFYTSMHWV